MKKLILIFTIFFTVVSFSQSKLNNYKYVLIPTQFEFQRTPDRYKINSLTKFLFNKAGFTALKTNESFPDDLAQNRCLALKTRILNSPTFLSTRVIIELVDCNNNVVFTTRQGKSRLKDYRQAYNEAIRAAFKDIENANYQYKPIVKIENGLGDITLNNKVLKEKVIQNITSKGSINQKIAQKQEAGVIAKNTLELIGKYQIGDYGVCTLTKDKDNFKILTGDENFEIAKVYKTSKPGIFIIKWVAFKQPRLLQLTLQGNLKIDVKKGVKEYNRVK
jgi:hypothetical protein